MGTHFNDVLFINLDNFLKHSSDKFNDWSKYKSHEYCDHSKLAAKNQCNYYDKYVEAHAAQSEME